MVTATIEPPVEEKRFALPKIKVGKPAFVWWNTTPEPNGACIALVTSVGLLTIDVIAFPPKTGGFRVYFGVRHRDDPAKINPEDMSQSWWAGYWWEMEFDPKSVAHVEDRIAKLDEYYDSQFKQIKQDIKVLRAELTKK